MRRTTKAGVLKIVVMDGLGFQTKTESHGFTDGNYPGIINVTDNRARYDK